MMRPVFITPRPLSLGHRQVYDWSSPNLGGPAKLEVRQYVYDTCSRRKLGQGFAAST